MTTDKPEPMSAEWCIEVINGRRCSCSESYAYPYNEMDHVPWCELFKVIDAIRSLDERARKAERNFEQAAACHKEALGWYNEAKAQVAEQAKEIAELKKPAPLKFYNQHTPECDAMPEDLKCYCAQRLGRNVLQKLMKGKR